jgi:hypothetical protein
MNGSRIRQEFYVVPRRSLQDRLLRNATRYCAKHDSYTINDVIRSVMGTLNSYNARGVAAMTELERPGGER